MQDQGCNTGAIGQGQKINVTGQENSGENRA